jgi:hypothetical protein
MIAEARERRQQRWVTANQAGWRKESKGGPLRQS